MRRWLLVAGLLIAASYHLYHLYWIWFATLPRWQCYYIPVDYLNYQHCVWTRFVKMDYLSYAFHLGLTLAEICAMILLIGDERDRR